MNLHTFKDVLSSKRSSLINDTAILTNTAGDDDDEDDEAVGTLEQEVEGEVEASYERFNDAGEVLEPFNLKEERERGKFDSNLNFVFEKNNAEVDAWVAELDEATMERGIGEASLALKRRQEAEARSERDAEDRRFKGSFLELCLHLLGVMQPGENLARAMRRLKREDQSSTTTSTSLQNSSTKTTAVVAKSQSHGSKTIEFLTDIADQLITAGLTGIYEMVYEAIESLISLWQYQSIDGAIQGPFPFKTIVSWKQQGYFTGDSAVLMRRVLNTDESTLGLRGSKPKEAVLPDWREESDEGEGDGEGDGEGTEQPRKRVRFETSTTTPTAPAAVSTSSASADLMGDLDEDDDEEEDEQVMNNKAGHTQAATNTTAIIDNSTHRLERLLFLASKTQSFDSSGFGEWVMSDEILSYEEVIAQASRDDDNSNSKRERGKFDSNLNFVFEKNNAEVDAWVAELDEATMERGIGEASLALKRRQEAEARSERDAEDRRFKGSFLELCLHLLGVMQPGENLARAMRRLKREDQSSTTTSTSLQNSSSKTTGVVAKSQSHGSKTIEFLTDIADQLITAGLTGIYEMVYEAIESLISLWQYQSIDGAIQGPFPFKTILSWKQQGYFTGDSAVLMRRVLNTDESTLGLRGSKPKEAVLPDWREEEEEDSDKGKGEEEGNGTEPPRKRVRLETSTTTTTPTTATHAAVSTSSAAADLMGDLDDDDEEEDEQVMNNKAGHTQATTTPTTIIDSSTHQLERLLFLASKTQSFDSSGFGEWVMSDEILSYEEVIARASRDDDNSSSSKLLA